MDSRRNSVRINVEMNQLIKEYIMNKKNHITGNSEYQQSMDGSQARIEKHIGDIPVRYQPLFNRSISGKVSPREAIKAKCLECMGYKKAEVRLCTAPTCPLFTLRPYRNAS